MPCQGQGVVAYPLTVRKEPPALAMLCSLLPVACDHLTAPVQPLGALPLQCPEEFNGTESTACEKGVGLICEGQRQGYIPAGVQNPPVFIKNRVVLPVQKCTVLYQFEDIILFLKRLYSMQETGVVE